jgi:hypothetical protein
MATGKPVEVAYFYKVKWGCQDEFMALFRKNHYPLLKAQVESGRLLGIRAYTPKFHGDGRNDWTFMTVLTFRDWEALGASSEKELAERLFPDRDAFQREERRRFEIVEAHWDTPLREAPME